MCTIFSYIRIAAIKCCKIKTKLFIIILLGGCFVLRYGLKYPRLASTHVEAKDGPKLEVLLLLLPARWDYRIFAPPCMLYKVLGTKNWTVGLGSHYSWVPF